MPAPDFQINDTQANRRPATLTDQHGREWFAEMDLKSGFPVGLVRLRHRTPKGNGVPWKPEQGYLVFTRHDPHKVRIDYDTMLAERLAAHDAYHKQAIREANARGWEVPQEGGPYAPQILELIGSPPHPWQPIKAAMDGNSYILGFTDVVDSRLEPFVRKETRVEKLVKGLPSFADEGADPIPPEQEDDDEEQERIAAQVEAMRTKGGRVRNTKGQYEPATVEG
jgi:hypothetical protein